MLDRLCVKNFALIDELEVEFGNGLNVISGETGAGKSIIIGSLNFVLGGKADKDIIKTGCESTEVSALIYTDSQELKMRLEENDVEIDDDNCILLKRIFNANGKSLCKINGKTATVGMLREISSYLVDIHGQHDHQSLLNVKNHIIMLDKLCSEALKEPMARLSSLFGEYKSLLARLREIDLNDRDIQDKVDLYRYQINEIGSAALKEGEDEELSERKNILMSSEKLKLSVNKCLEVLSRGEGSALDNIGIAVSEYENVVSIDEGEKEVLEALNDCYSILEDAVKSIRNYEELTEYDPEELDNIEERLQVIYELKKKYGPTIGAVNSYMERVAQKLEDIENSQELICQYDKKKIKLEAEINEVCSEITAIRKDTAKTVSGSIEKALRELSMENARFEIKVSPKGSFDEKGSDNVEFMISANRGEDIKPLNKIASGGEMSRVMLALKSILADVDNIDTFIFDEIDAGISGRTAQKVAEKMCRIAKSHQIICITHLPQIAAMADKNYLIEKKDHNLSTVTNIVELSDDKVYNELARLIGGAEITDATEDAAREMKIMADRLKGE